MSEQHPYVGVRRRRNEPAGSRRERAALHRSERARAHLERVRGEKTPRPVPSLSLAAPIAIVTSIILGAAFGSPLVAAARSWIAGEPIRLESISVSGASRLSLPEIGHATALPKGALIAAIEPDEVEANLLTHPWISDATVVRLPASQLLIRITEQVAQAVVAVGKERVWHVVSSTGLPFARASESEIESLPRLVPGSAANLELTNRLARGERATQEPSEALAEAIEFTARFPAFDLPIPSEIVIDDGLGQEGWVVRLPSLRPRVILGRENLDERLAALAELIGARREELAEASAIDLRFAKQAVLRSTPSPEGTAQAATTRNSVALPKPRPTG